MDNIRTLVTESSMRFVDYTALGESAKEPESIKKIRPTMIEGSGMSLVTSAQCSKRLKEILEPT